MMSIVLASASEARRILLRRAGVSFTCDPAAIDEGAIKRRAQAERLTVSATAMLLAEAKARAVSRRHADALIIGADQMLFCRGRIFSKPKDREEAEAVLKLLRSRTHRLVSAVTVMRNDDVIWNYVETARLTMRCFSDRFLTQYLVDAGEGAMQSVGVYRVEGIGLQLFSHIDGDHSTILGLPLVPLLEVLRREGAIPE